MALITFLVPLLVLFVALVGFSTTAALACACGCSVFDVGGLDLPQEQDHGGRVFLEYWSGDQTENYIGSSKAPGALNSDKEINTQWINVGFSYQFNRDWGVMVRIPTTNRTLTTDTGAFAGVQPFNSKDIGDIEIMGMYTGFFKDYVHRRHLWSQTSDRHFHRAWTRPRHPDRIGQHRSYCLAPSIAACSPATTPGSIFPQIMWRQPFLYQSAADPQGFFDGNPGVVQTYYPGMQVDAAAGINYNNLYHVIGFDKITPLAQVIVSHRDHDTGTGSDPFNSGFDRVMLSPGIEFTKVIDEANNRVVKFYADVEVPIYYRANAANNAGTDGQLVAPYLIKLVASYNF